MGLIGGQIVTNTGAFQFLILWSLIAEFNGAHTMEETFIATMGLVSVQILTYSLGYTQELVPSSSYSISKLRSRVYHESNICIYYRVHWYNSDVLLRYIQEILNSSSYGTSEWRITAYRP